MSTNKKQEEPTSLRRSTRSTRGSIKPLVVEPTKSELSDQDDEHEKTDGSREADEVNDFQMSEPSDNDNDDDNDDDDEYEETTTKSKRNSTATKVRRKSTATNKKQPANVEKSTRKTSKKQETEPKSSTKISAKNTKTKSSKKQEPEEETEADDVHIYYELSEKEMKEVNNAFDLNCNTEELLVGDDLKTVIRFLGFEPRNDEIQSFLKKFSKNGMINRDGFHKIMAFKMGSSISVKDNDSNDEISRVFNLLDLDKTGMITLDNLRSISKELNEEITDEELHEMIVEADIDGDFQINKQEFYNIMKKTSLY